MSRFVKAIVSGIVFLFGPLLMQAEACHPIHDRVVGLPAGTPAQQLTSFASSVEVMRITTRRFASPPPLVDTTDTYSFQFVPVRVLKGPSCGPLLLYGSAALSADSVSKHKFGYLDWNDQQTRERGLSKSGPALWRQRYGAFYLGNVVEPTPGVAITSCETFYSFVVGRDYLVFRDADGRLLQRGFEAEVGRVWDGRPDTFAVRGLSIQRVFGPQDYWLRSVERAVESQRRRAR